MKVLFIEPCYKNFGGYFRAINFCQALAKHNIQVTLVVPSNKNFILKINHYKQTDNFDIYELPRIKLGLLFQARIIRGLITVAIALYRNYDIVHAEAPVQPETIIPATLLKLIGKKVIIDWDDMYQNGVFSNNKPIHFYIKTCETYFPKLFKYITVNNDLLRKLALKRGAKQAIMLINAVDPNQFQFIPRKVARRKLHLNQKDLYLITIGHTYAKGRLVKLVSLFNDICQINKKVKLLVNFDLNKTIARNSDLKKLINRNNRNKIINLGYIKDKHLNYYLSSADMAIFTFGDHITEKACYPIRISGYISARLPTIVNDNGNQPVKTLKKYNCLITGKTNQLIAQNVKKYLESPDLQRKMNSSLKKAEKLLSWDNVCLPIIDLYRQVISSP